MKVHKGSSPDLNGSVVAIGGFDGMHLGHQAVIREVVKRSELYNVPSVVYTFDPPPRYYFQESIILTSIEQKIRKIKELKVENVIVAHFNKRYTQRSATSFIKELEKIQPKEIIVGSNFRFGKNKEGDVQKLKEHFKVRNPEPVYCTKGEVISSTRIRKLINIGKTREAIFLLG